jgi:transposase
MRSSTLKAIMQRIADGKISRADAADRLGVSERTVNRLMQKHEVKRPPSPVHEQRAAAAARRARKREAAEQHLAGKLTIEEAAERADVSERTMYRWKNRLQNAQKPKKTARK